MKIGFIGAGKVGCSLAKYFCQYGITVTGFYSRAYASALEASEFTKSRVYTSIAALLNECDCIMITVPDNQIRHVWDQLCQYSLDDKLVGHCSGLLTSSLFVYHDVIYPFGFSLHPLYAIYDKFTCHKLMPNAHFTLQANENIKMQLLYCLSVLPNPVAIISGEKKALYHAACVMLSNQMIALAKIGSDMLKLCDLENEFSEQGWHSLFLGNAHSLCDQGFAQALTGPIERADIETVKQHLSIMPPEIKPIYQQLSLVLVTISQQKHPNRDYQPLQLELLS